MSEPGSMTTPQPMTHRRPLCRMPDGIVCSTYFSRPTTTVWPALFPPEKRTTTLTWGVMTSTTLPLPSSPHCAPITTMLGITPLLHLCEVPLRLLQHVTDRQRLLSPTRPVQRQQLLRPRARAADDEYAPRPLSPRILQRLVQLPREDIAGDRGSAIA